MCADNWPPSAPRTGGRDKERLKGNQLLRAVDGWCYSTSQKHRVIDLVDTQQEHAAMPPDLATSLGSFATRADRARAQETARRRNSLIEQERAPWHCLGSADFSSPLRRPGPGQSASRRRAAPPNEAPRTPRPRPPSAAVPSPRRLACGPLPLPARSTNPWGRGPGSPWARHRPPRPRAMGGPNPASSRLVA